jgi:hypothetical protein
VSPRSILDDDRRRGVTFLEVLWFSSLLLGIFGLDLVKDVVGK